MHVYKFSALRLFIFFIFFFADLFILRSPLGLKKWDEGLLCSAHYLQKVCVRVYEQVLCVCICTCVCLCMYLRAYVGVHVHACVCLCACVACAYACEHVHVRVHVRARVRVVHSQAL